MCRSRKKKNRKLLSLDFLLKSDNIVIRFSDKGQLENYESKFTIDP
ncbi:hypothetical protein [Ruminiclostridium sufflavum]|nr:hypothetical protein [Ruminiclostridium sufflavum]